MVFLHARIVRQVCLEPRSFGGHLKAFFVEKLHREVEGRWDARYGFVLAITRIESWKRDGIALSEPLTVGFEGLAWFSVTFRAIALNFFRGEVLEGVVAETNKMGCFVECGPLTVFVSRRTMPAEYEFNHGLSCFVSKEDGGRIVRDADIRLRILGVRKDNNDAFAVGGINEDYLGLVSSE